MDESKENSDVADIRLTTHGEPSDGAQGFINESPENESKDEHTVSNTNEDETDAPGMGLPENDSATDQPTTSRGISDSLEESNSTILNAASESCPAVVCSLRHDVVNMIDIMPSDTSSTSATSGSTSGDETFHFDSVFRSRKRTSNASSSSSSDTNDVVPSPIILKEKPKHKWFVVQEVVNRQKGVGSRFQSSDLFRQRCYSSLHAVQRLELMYKLENHNGCVNSLHFNESGSLLASGSDDLHVVLWNWAAGRSVLKYKSGHRSNVFQTKFLPLAGNGTIIVTCSRDGQVRLGELSQAGACLSTKKLAGHCGAAHKLAIQPERPHVFLSCGEDGLVMSIDIREDKPRRLMFVKEGERKVALYGIHCNPMNNNEFLVNGRNNFIRIYDARMIQKNGPPLKKFSPAHLEYATTSTQVTSAVFSHDGSEIIGSYNDEDIYLFNTKDSNKNYKHKYEGHRNNVTVKGVNFFGPKSEYIVSGSDCGNIFFWEKNSEAIVQYMAGDEGGVVNCLEPHPHMPAIATSGLDSDVKIWVPSYEHDPALDGLQEAMLENYLSRERELPRTHAESANTLMRLWRRAQNVERRRMENQQNGSGDQASTTARNTADSSDSDSDSDTPVEHCLPS